MIETTLCYLTVEGKTLMLYRNKKPSDPNAGKYIGLGGHLEDGETPLDCAMREVREESGLILQNPAYRGIVDFLSDRWGNERMHLFTAEAFTGEIIPCNEGELCWLTREEFDALPQWEGDREFLRLLGEGVPWFELELHYQGEHLTAAIRKDQAVPTSEDDML